MLRPALRSAACIGRRIGAIPSGSAALRASLRSFSVDSHDDFKPKSKTLVAAGGDITKQIDGIITSNKVVLFMKGSPSQPQCGFSAQVVRLLHQHNVDITGVDILSNPELRTAMKEYSKWPTFPQVSELRAAMKEYSKWPIFPQLYVNGEFVGGCDIATQMQQSGELATLLAKAR